MTAFINVRKTCSKLRPVPFHSEEWFSPTNTMRLDDICPLISRG